MNKKSIKLLIGILNLVLVCTVAALVISIISTIAEFFKIGFNFKYLQNNIPLYAFYIGYTVIIKSLLNLVKSAKINPFTVINVKRLKIIGYVFFTGFLVDFTSNMLNPSKNIIIDIIGIKITQTMVFFVIFALLFFVFAEIFDSCMKTKQDDNSII